METWVWRLWPKAQEVVIGHVARDCNQIPSKGVCVAECEVLATGQSCNGLGNIQVETIARSDEDHPHQSQRREQIARAVQRLNAAVAVRVRVGIRIFAHAATRRVRCIHVRTSSLSRYFGRL